MKNILVLFLIVTFVSSCKNEAKEAVEVAENQEIAYASFGNKIESKDALSAATLAEKYETLKIGDTLHTKVTAKINEVCSRKGCWMKLDLGNEEEVMVRFKDYGFFMPLDASGEVIIKGKAYVTEVSVDELRHYAEDAGKSIEEIEAITAPEKTFAFEADGVLLKE